MAAAVKKTTPKPKGPRLEFYVDRKKEHRWRVVATNGKILADSGEGYKRYGDCSRGAESATVILLAAHQYSKRVGDRVQKTFPEMPCED